MFISFYVFEYHHWKPFKTKPGSIDLKHFLFRNENLSLLNSSAMQLKCTNIYQHRVNNFKFFLVKNEFIDHWTSNKANTSQCKVKVFFCIIALHKLLTTLQIKLDIPLSKLRLFLVYSFQYGMLIDWLLVASNWVGNHRWERKLKLLRKLMRETYV